jgi:hypothetical protein
MTDATFSPLGHAPSEIQISESELRSLTADMVDAHAETLNDATRASDTWAATHASFTSSGSKVLSRRRLLGVGGVAAAGIAVAGIEMRTMHGAGAVTSHKTVPVDVKVAALAASLENLAVATYAAGLKAATAGKLGKVPPAVATFAETAMAQHADHAQVWNATLKSAGYAKVTKPDPKEAIAVNDAFKKVKSITGLAQLALLLEGVAAATYLEGLSVVTSTEAKQTAASIQPVEMQHVAILRFVLGENPVPNAFASMAGARPVSDNPYL